MVRFRLAARFGLAVEAFRKAKRFGGLGLDEARALIETHDAMWAHGLGAVTLSTNERDLVYSVSDALSMTTDEAMRGHLQVVYDRAIVAAAEAILAVLDDGDDDETLRKVPSAPPAALLEVM